MTKHIVILEESAFIRKVLSTAINSTEGIDIVGIARNEEDAFSMIKKRKPHAIVLTTNTLLSLYGESQPEISHLYGVPIVVCDVDGNVVLNNDTLKNNILNLISSTSFESVDIYNVRRNKFKAVVIGSSTGGPNALSNIIKYLPSNMKVPIFIVQHIPQKFSTSLAQRLDSESNVEVFEAIDGMKIKPGVVYMAPGGYHMIMDREKIYLKDGDRLHGVIPAADILFNSAADVYKEDLLGVILTGMGKDGTEGMAKIKSLGGYNIVQNKETSVVYGMPGNAVARGIVDEILSIEDISKRLNIIVR